MISAPNSFLADPTGGAYSAPPDPLAGSRGPTSKEGSGWRGEIEGERERGREEPAPLSQIPGSVPVPDTECAQVHQGKPLGDLQIAVLLLL